MDIVKLTRRPRWKRILYLPKFWWHTWKIGNRVSNKERLRTIILLSKVLVANSGGR